MRCPTDNELKEIKVIAATGGMAASAIHTTKQLDQTYIRCTICNQVIVKYSLDLGDTVVFTPRGHPQTVYICEECSYQIAKQRIARS
jgi:uncharacterized protein YlaI